MQQQQMMMATRIRIQVQLSSNSRQKQLFISYTFLCLHAGIRTRHRPDARETFASLNVSICKPFDCVPSACREIDNFGYSSHGLLPPLRDPLGCNRLAAIAR